ncbi:MAG: GNAT family N-acetyltransferase, partial [Clostridia bacterium]|nr:GNAT family N-acetyltransferase [Clostridia bacterium]
AMFENWAHDPEVTKFLTWPAHASVGVTESLLENWVSRYTKPDFYNWAITLKDCDRPVGNISVVRVDDNISEAVIGYCLSRARWGMGIMTEALSAVMDDLFDIGFLRVSACHDVRNPASGRVMEKAGMKTEGCLRQSGRNNLGISDIIWHAALRDEYLKEKGRKENE